MRNELSILETQEIFAKLSPIETRESQWWRLVVDAVFDLPCEVSMVWESGGWSGKRKRWLAEDQGGRMTVETVHVSGEEAKKLWPLLKGMQPPIINWAWDGPLGRDGSVFVFERGLGFNHLCFEWWDAGSGPEWDALTTLANKLQSVQAAWPWKPFETWQINWESEQTIGVRSSESHWWLHVNSRQA